MSTILLLEAVNLFMGDADPEKSKHLSLTSMTLPTLLDILRPSASTMCPRQRTLRYGVDPRTSVLTASSE